MTNTPDYFTDQEAATALRFIAGWLHNLDQDRDPAAELEEAFIRGIRYALVMNDPEATHADRLAVALGRVA